MNLNLDLEIIKLLTAFNYLIGLESQLLECLKITINYILRESIAAAVLLFFQ